MKNSKTISLILLAIIILFTVTGCVKNNIKKEDKIKDAKSMEYLLDQFIKAYTKPDVEIIQEIFPPYYVKYAKNYLTQEYLESSLKKDKEKYGDDFTITYEITDTIKLSDKELDEVNKKMVSYFNTTDKATEGYKYEGSIIYKGSKKEEKNDLFFLYCKYGDEWYLVRK